MRISQHITPALIIVGVATLCISYFQYRQHAVSSILREHAGIAEAELVKLALALDTNTLPEGNVSVQDCDARDRFDTLLSRLPALTAPEYKELQFLYDGCAAYSTLVREFTLAAFSGRLREYEQITQYRMLLRGARAKDTDPIIGELHAFESLETKRLEGTKAQQIVQKEIIEQLTHAKDAGVRDEIESRMVRAQQNAIELSTLNTQIDELRAQLMQKITAGVDTTL